MDLSPGTRLFTPGGDTVVLEWDHASQVVRTPLGTFREEDITETPRPLNPTAEALAAWLAGPALAAIPKQRAVSATTECACPCKKCHCLVTFVNSKPSNRTHMPGPQCLCAQRGCPCVPRR